MAGKAPLASDAHGIWPDGLEMLCVDANEAFLNMQVQDHLMKALTETKADVHVTAIVQL